jgi:hypothetical protein
MIKMLFASTIFSSAFLLFLVQPIVSKNILPWFGGSAGVWSVCMVFFQVVLLFGYGYSHWTTKHLQLKHQVTLHILLLIASLLSLPVIADTSWKPIGNEDPTIWILLLLISTVGLPYFLLSTTGPLIQFWASHTLIGAQVYRFFSLSNLASLVALLCYPFLIEPYASLAEQANAWSAVYSLFVALCAASGIYFYRHRRAIANRGHSEEKGAQVDASPPALRDRLWWLSLSAMGAWLLLAITNHITQNVAAIPFLWLLPLTLYLLTFVLCFESDRWYRRHHMLLPAALLLAVCAYGLHAGEVGGTVKIAIPLYAAGLFVLCMFLHGELAALKPAPQHLTQFYLMVSLGGAIGGIVVGLIAPHVLPAYYELGIGLVIIALLAMRVLAEQKLLFAVSSMLALLCAYFLGVQVTDDFRDARQIVRNFYGTLLTVDVKRPTPIDNVRQLYHGSVLHGEQYLATSRRAEPTTYYGPTSGIGLAILHNNNQQHKKVGVIGLGAGTLAIYGKMGDLYRFYEINPQVIDLAQGEFRFLQGSQARIETVLGDARLVLDKEASNGFNVLAVDAFSGDAIPVHLITREALTVYQRHINDDGIIAFHVTNRFLSLAPVVEKLALNQGMYAALIHDEAKGLPWPRTDWVLVAKNSRVLQKRAIENATSTIEKIPGLGVWTDDFNNLFRVVK